MGYDFDGDDSISRKAAIDAIMGEPPEANYPVYYAGLIRRLPAAEVFGNSEQLKTAHWKTHIFDGIMGGRPRAYMCGYCNFISLAQTNYCPHCGAKMEVKHEA